MYFMEEETEKRFIIHWECQGRIKERCSVRENVIPVHCVGG
jgi:hypothetical protein